MAATPEMIMREAPAGTYNVGRIRQDFPILSHRVHGKPLVYLDNAATSQKPRAVIDAITRYYETGNANIHRGVHQLSEQATQAYEEARERVRRFVNAETTRSVIFVRGTTEGINLVAQSFVRPRLRPGDEILLSAMEHHSNIVPWQLLCDDTGARIRVIPMNDAGELLAGDYERLLSEKVRIVGLAHVSNALGTVNPIRHMIRSAHARGIPVLIDGAQAVPHMAVDVRDLDCDFYAFSAHKMYGPTGTGVLYGREELLNHMKPYQGGGDMIRSVTFEKTLYNDLPYRFEAGTPHIAGGIALGAAIDYLADLGLPAIAAHEHDLLQYATGALSEIPGVRVIGTARDKASVLSFILEDIHPHDIGTIIDREGIAIRTGHHCAQPVMARFGIPATARASFGLYNTRDEVDVLVRGVRRVIEVMH